MSEEPKTVWIVTSGEYSDYRYHGIFSTEEKAKEYAAKLCTERNHDVPDCTAVEVDALEDAEMRLTYICHLDIGGNVVKEFTGSEALVSLRDRGSSNPCNPNNGPTIFFGQGYSHEQARKLAVECRQAYLREQTEPKGGDQ